jgi:hypothetical protein
VTSSSATLLKRQPDPAIIRLVRALARDTAREDHEHESTERKTRLDGEETK